MHTTQIERQKLIQIVTENRSKHDAAFEEAWAGYLIEIRERVEKLAANTRDFANYVDTELLKEETFDIPELLKKLYACKVEPVVAPINQKKSYDMILRKLELDTRETIELDDEEFKQYVLDEWDWTNQFVAASMMYSNKLRN